MKPKHPAFKPVIKADVTFVNGKQKITMELSNTNLDDWKNASFILQQLEITGKTLRNWRDNKVIPCGKLGGTYFYYLPGILFILEKSAAI